MLPLMIFPNLLHQQTKKLRKLLMLLMDFLCRYATSRPFQCYKFLTSDAEVTLCQTHCCLTRTNQGKTWATRVLTFDRIQCSFYTSRGLRFNATCQAGQRSFRVSRQNLPLPNGIEHVFPFSFSYRVILRKHLRAEEALPETADFFLSERDPGLPQRAQNPGVL